jgi:prevent-host-death family protein
MVKTVPAKQARENFSGLLDDAESGKGAVVIIRNSKPAAAVVPPEFAEALPLVQAILSDLGLSLEMAQDQEVVRAYQRGLDDIAREDIVWYEV